MAATGVEYGEVFTRRWVVELILDLGGYTITRDLTKLVVVEPSIGPGAFVGPILERLVVAKELALVSKRLGHSSVTITSDTYSHSLGGVGREAAEKAAALVPRKALRRDPCDQSVTRSLEIPSG